MKNKNFLTELKTEDAVVCMRRAHKLICLNNWSWVDETIPPYWRKCVTRGRIWGFKRLPPFLVSHSLFLSPLSLLCPSLSFQIVNQDVSSPSFPAAIPLLGYHVLSNPPETISTKFKYCRGSCSHACLGAGYRCAWPHLQGRGQGDIEWDFQGTAFLFQFHILYMLDKMYSFISCLWHGVLSQQHKMTKAEVWGTLKITGFLCVL